MRLGDRAPTLSVTRVDECSEKITGQRSESCIVIFKSDILLLVGVVP